MQSIKQFSIKNNTTFGVDATVAEYIVFHTEKEAVSCLSEQKIDPNLTLVLGGGSNYLFTKNAPYTVLHPEIKGREIVKETQEQVWVKFGAGEEWDDVVEYAVSNNYGGIENLSYIPGNIGASPVQNIGAYGTEIKDVFFELDAVEIATGKKLRFNKSECNFRYRNSFFKEEGFRKYLITSVTLVLQKNAKAQLSYKALVKHFEGKPEPTIREVRDAVVSIRKSKLPEPEDFGNAGSFFKNPVVEQSKAERLLQEHPDLVHFPLPNGEVKLAAGWLIEQAGLKGYRIGDAGVYEKQALVLVNHGNATGEELFQLSKFVRSSVLKEFGVMLECEVNIV